MADPLQIIQATLAPMFLITGVGVYLNFVQARLFRTIDRIRQVPADALDLPFLEWRLQALRNSIALGTLSIALVALAAVFLLAAARMPNLSEAAIVSFSGALAAFVVSIAYGLQDTFRSVRNAESIVPEESTRDEAD